MGRLSGKVAIVTGGAQGLGIAIAAAYLAEGSSVAVIDINADELDEAKRKLKPSGGKLLTRVTDITDRSAVRDLVTRTTDELGPIDILVNNAVWAKYQQLHEVDEETLDRMISVGLKGQIWMIQAVAAGMTGRKSGSIINMSSISGMIGMAYSPVYAGVKGGIDGLTRALAVDLGQSNIRVNAISPSAIPSPMSRRILGEAGWEGRKRRTPLGRVGKPEDVASTAVFLGSDESSFITGEVIRVDGGYCIGGAIPGVDVERR